MARATRDIWARRVDEWTGSGLTARDFSNRAGVNPNTLAHWKWKLGSESTGPRGPVATGIGFVELSPGAGVSPAQESERFEIVLPGGVRVFVPAGFDCAALRSLLATLENG